MSGPSEKRIQNEALIAMSQHPRTLLWRNNTGSAWQGTIVRAATGQSVVVRPGMVILTEARPVSFGLPGSSDIIGVSDGRAIFAEAKAEAGRQSEQQRKFEAAVERAGGVYGLFRSVDEALAILRGSVR